MPSSPETQIAWAQGYISETYGCPLCHGTGLVSDTGACGDPDHCDGWALCPAGCPEET